MSPDRDSIGRRAAEVLNQAYQQALQVRRDGFEVTAINTLLTAAEMGKVEIIDPNDYLGLARDNLVAGESGIFYFGPHFGGFPPDVATVGKVTETVVPLSETAIYTAERHVDPTRGENRVSRGYHRAEYAVIEQARKIKGFTPISVVQSIDRDYYFANREAIGGMTPLRFNVKAVETAAEFLIGTKDRPIGGRALVIATGGTRDPQAKLSRAHAGLEYTLKAIRANGFAVGIALEPNLRKNLPLVGKIRARITRPITWEDVTGKYETLQREAMEKDQALEITRSDLMMIPIAYLLDPKHQGYYRLILQRFPKLADPRNW